MILIPAPTDQLIETAELWNSRRCSKHPQKTAHKIIVAGKDNLTEIFQQLPIDEPIYVYAHGVAWDPETRQYSIGNGQKINRIMFSADNLASLFKNSLNINHQTIKIFSCRSAVSCRNDYSKQSFAEQFSRIMATLGYTNLKTFGYISYVNVFGYNYSKSAHYFRKIFYEQRSESSRTKFHRKCFFNLSPLSPIEEKAEKNDKAYFLRYSR